MSLVFWIYAVMVKWVRLTFLSLFWFFACLISSPFLYPCKKFRRVQKTLLKLWPAQKMRWIHIWNPCRCMDYSTIILFRLTAFRSTDQTSKADYSAMPLRAWLDLMVTFDAGDTGMCAQQLINFVVDDALTVIHVVIQVFRPLCRCSFIYIDMTFLTTSMMRLPWHWLSRGRCWSPAISTVWHCSQCLASIMLRITKIVQGASAKRPRAHVGADKASLTQSVSIFPSCAVIGVVISNR